LERRWIFLWKYKRISKAGRRYKKEYFLRSSRIMEDHRELTGATITQTKIQESQELAASSMATSLLFYKG
jgi:hypothetical protein